MLSIREMTRYVRAFVFLETTIGKEENVMEQLLKIEEVKEVHVITGEKDVLVVLELKSAILSQNAQVVSDFIRNKIGNLTHVKDTDTIVPYRSKTKWPI